jgi:hypothetical protein
VQRPRGSPTLRAVGAPAAVIQASGAVRVGQPETSAFHCSVTFRAFETLMFCIELVVSHGGRRLSAPQQRECRLAAPSSARTAVRPSCPLPLPSGGRANSSGESSSAPGLRMSAISATERRTLLRVVNQEILKIAEGWQLRDTVITFHCECGLAGCRESVALLPSEYSRLTRRADTVLLAPDHQADAYGNSSSE